MSCSWNSSELNREPGSVCSSTDCNSESGKTQTGMWSGNLLILLMCCTLWCVSALLKHIVLLLYQNLYSQTVNIQWNMLFLSALQHWVGALHSSLSVCKQFHAAVFSMKKDYRQHWSSVLCHSGSCVWFLLSVPYRFPSPTPITCADVVVFPPSCFYTLSSSLNSLQKRLMSGNVFFWSWCFCKEHYKNLMQYHCGSVTTTTTG